MYFGGINNICWHVIEILSHLVDKITRIKGYKLYIFRYIERRKEGEKEIERNSYIYRDEKERTKQSQIFFLLFREKGRERE